MSSSSVNSAYSASPSPASSAAPLVVVESRLSVLFKTALSGVGFMCDAYDLFVMNVLLVVIGCDLAVQDDADNTAHTACYLAPASKAALATAVLVGSVSAADTRQLNNAHTRSTGTAAQPRR